MNILLPNDNLQTIEKHQANKFPVNCLNCRHSVGTTTPSKNGVDDLSFDLSSLPLNSSINKNIFNGCNNLENIDILYSTFMQQNVLSASSSVQEVETNNIPLTFVVIFCKL